MFQLAARGRQSPIFPRSLPFGSLEDLSEFETESERRHFSASTARQLEVLRGNVHSFDVVSIVLLFCRTIRNF